MEYVARFQDLPAPASEEQIHKWVNELRAMLIMEKSEEEIQEWYENLWKIYGPKRIGQNQCPHEFSLYTVDSKVHLPIHGHAYQDDLACLDPGCPK